MKMHIKCDDSPVVIELPYEKAIIISSLQINRTKDVRNWPQDNS